MFSEFNRINLLRLSTKKYSVYYEATQNILEINKELRRSLEFYIVLEKKNGFPINLNYRNYLKRLNK